MSVMTRRIGEGYPWRAPTYISGRQDGSRQIIRVVVPRTTDSVTASLCALFLALLVSAPFGGATIAIAQSSGTFTPTGNMTALRGQHSATLLPDGRVLIAGGTSSGSSMQASTEFYDPGTGTFGA